MTVTLRFTAIATTPRWLNKMKAHLAALLIFTVSVPLHVGAFGSELLDPEEIIKQLEEGEIKEGCSVMDMPRKKPSTVHFLSEGENTWLLQVFEYKKRQLNLHWKNDELFMARLFDERKGIKKTDRVYFCNFELWREFVEANIAKANQALHSTETSSAE